MKDAHTIAFCFCFFTSSYWTYCSVLISNLHILLARRCACVEKQLSWPHRQLMMSSYSISSDQQSSFILKSDGGDVTDRSPQFWTTATWFCSTQTSRTPWETHSSGNECLPLCRCLVKLSPWRGKEKKKNKIFFFFFYSNIPASGCHFSFFKYWPHTPQDTKCIANSEFILPMRLLRRH